MTRTLCILTTAMMALLLAGPGSALHCNGDITTIGTGPMILYMDDRSDEAGEINHWFYLESNGVEGLQSGSDVICPSLQCMKEVPISFVDGCSHADPDTLII